MGNMWAAMLQMYPPRSNFSTDQMPDLTGQVMVVTGGNSGIGFENVKALLEHNARVYLATRSKEKADAAIKDLSAQTGKEAIFLELDLSDLASVRRSAEEFLSKEKELHVLFNNAGVMIPPLELITKDGFDLQFGTNVIGHFLFTELLMPALFAATETAPDHHARVITVSSSAAYFFTVDWNSFVDGPARRQMTTNRLYHQSKFANVVVARQIAKRYADRGIISISLNPGNIITDCQRYVPSLKRGIARAVMGYMPPLGALTQLWAGTMPEALNHNGEFFIPWARVGRCRDEAYDDELGKRLWAWLEEAVKNKGLERDAAA